MIKDQIQAEADKAAKAIHEALAEFHRVTGLEVKAEAGWFSSQKYSADDLGTYTIKRELRAVVEVVCAASSASGAKIVVAPPAKRPMGPLWGYQPEGVAGYRCPPPSDP